MQLGWAFAAQLQLFGAERCLGFLGFLGVSSVFFGRERMLFGREQLERPQRL